MDQSQKRVAGESQPEAEEIGAISVDEMDGLSLSSSIEEFASLTGTTIGHYLIGERLGGGAMAAVYRAQDQILDRSVAIKVLLPGADSVMQARFRREARLVSGLVHPHIVRTLQVGRSGGIVYIAMELVEGVSLADLLERKGKLLMADAAHILAPIADALAYAHSKSIVHRDVKPSNILLKRANPGAPQSVTVAPLPYPVIPLLSDFGIARAVDAPELTNAGRTIGTPAFMAPEQCAGSADIDGRADIYALGAVLYRCLVGRPPFAGTTTQILHAHVYDPLLIPDEVVATLPEPMVQILAKSMAKEASQRYDRVELMVEELEAVADLPVVPGTPLQLPMVDPTMTMASLPVTPSPGTGTSRVLVPATGVTTVNNVPKAPAMLPFGGSAAARPLPVAPYAPAAPARKPKARQQTNRNGWRIMALGAAFVALVALAAIILVNSMLPAAENPAANSTATPIAVAQPKPTQPAAVGPVLTAGSAEDATPDLGSNAVAPIVSPSPQVSGGGSCGTPSTELPPDVRPGYAWEQAQYFYDHGQWEEALDWLNLVWRIVLAPASAGEPRLDVEKPTVRAMLTVTCFGVAIDYFASAKFDESLANLDQALKSSPKNPFFASARTTIESFAKLEGQTGVDDEEERKALRKQLAKNLAAYAADFEAKEDYCQANLQIGNALAVSATNELEDKRNELAEKCDAQNSNNAILKVGGSILYSSERLDGSKRKDIWRLPISAPNLASQQSIPLIEDASQPQLSPSGATLAYYNLSQGGLWGISLRADWTPNGISTRYSANVEDGRDAPATWSPRGDKVAYSTAFPNLPSHISATSVDADTDADVITDGKDPAWNPKDDVLVFNAYDNGQLPGLFTMQLGGDRERLTENGSDQRPTWTPDGKSIVFMGKDHAGDEAGGWEIYRLDRESGNVTRLTDNNPAQDGLPSVSPDGKWVAFMSDRGQTWRLWYVSIDGGEVKFLSGIAGQPIAWLEHSIQWVK